MLGVLQRSSANLKTEHSERLMRETSWRHDPAGTFTYKAHSERPTFHYFGSPPALNHICAVKAEYEQELWDLKKSHFYILLEEKIGHVLS